MDGRNAGRRVSRWEAEGGEVVRCWQRRDMEIGAWEKGWWARNRVSRGGEVEQHEAASRALIWSARFYWAGYVDAAHELLSDLQAFTPGLDDQHVVAHTFVDQPHR